MSSSSFLGKYYYERDEVWLDVFDGIASSRAWKLVTMMRKLRLWLIPKDSRHERLVAKVWRRMRNGISHEN